MKLPDQAFKIQSFKQTYTLLFDLTFDQSQNNLLVLSKKIVIENNVIYLQFIYKVFYNK